MLRFAFWVRLRRTPCAHTGCSRITPPQRPHAYIYTVVTRIPHRVVVCGESSNRASGHLVGLSPVATVPTRTFTRYTFWLLRLRSHVSGRLRTHAAFACTHTTYRARWILSSSLGGISVLEPHRVLPYLVLFYDLPSVYIWFTRCWIRFVYTHTAPCLLVGARAWTLQLPAVCCRFHTYTCRTLRVYFC